MKQKDFLIQLEWVCTNYPALRTINSFVICTRRYELMRDLGFPEEYWKATQTEHTARAEARNSKKTVCRPEFSLDELCNLPKTGVSSDVGTRKNCLSVFLTDLTRLWLYFDLLPAAPVHKVREWFLRYCKEDFVKYNEALEAVYELARRGTLARLTVSQFKAAIKDYGISCNLLLGPTWPDVERYLTSEVRNQSDVGIVRLVVQWTRLSARATLDNPLLEEECLRKFEDNQNRLSSIWSVPDPRREVILCRLRRIIDKLFVDDAAFRVLPGHHGSGAVSEVQPHRLASLKCNYLAQSDELLSFFTRRFGVSVKADLPDYYTGKLPSSTVLNRESRWLTVPKSIKKRRGIAPQPACLMWYQQGVLDGYYSTVWGRDLPTRRPPGESHKRDPIKSERQRFVSEHLPIFNRDVNREIAIRGSKYNHWATYDMSDASDSITVHMIKRVFGPNLRLALVACRCVRTSSTSHMETYGTMGDASVFPTESIIFGACLVLALIEARELEQQRYPNRTYSEIHLRQWTVFGDDIACQSHPLVDECLHDICTHLGFKINDDKSFTEGPYRESCGIEAYLGHSIEPWYFLNRASFPVERANQVATLVSAANACYERGFYSTRQFYIWLLSRRVWGYDLIPFTTHSDDGSRVLTPFLSDRGVFRYSRDLQKVQRREVVVLSKEERDDADLEWEQWYRYYLYLLNPPKRESGWDAETFTVTEAVQRSFLNRALHIRKVWADVELLEK